MAGFVAGPAVDTGDAGTAALARAIVERLSDDVCTGRIQRAALAVPVNPATPAASPVHVVSTNWGVVPDLVTPAGVTITDFRATVPAGHAKPRITPLSATVITTFDRRLSLDSTASPAEMATIAQRVRRLL
nr:hypothetical protein [Nocardia bovistercoris]